MTRLPPKPPPKLPPRGGPMSPPPLRPALPPMPASPPPPPAAPAPLAAHAMPPGRGLPPRPGSAPQPARQPPPRPGARGAAPMSAHPAAQTPPRPGTPAGAARSAQIAAAGAQGTVGALIEAVRLVDTVLSEENEVLRRHDARGAAALQERKAAATRLYHERMRILAQDSEATRAIGPEQKAELVQMARELDERVRENAILLKATIVSIDRLFAAVSQAAQEKVKREIAYSRKGLVASATRPGEASVAFNQNV